MLESFLNRMWLGLKGKHYLAVSELKSVFYAKKVTKCLAHEALETK
jgi:hypothetical protein